MWLQKNLSRNIFLASFVFCLFGCFGKPGVNDVFEKKYGKEIEKISLQRTPPKTSSKNDSKLNFETPVAPIFNDPARSVNSAYEQYYANVDAEEYAGTQPRNFFPDAGVYSQGKNAPGSLPQNMFDIIYHTRLSPPFRRSGFEFDLINIPPRDAYGVVTAMSEKEYLLVGNASLQKNIDKIHSDKTAEDIEMSEILIKEQRQLRRRQKMIKVFGPDSLQQSDTKKDSPEIVAEDSVEEVENDGIDIVKNN
jgi:hypothetical protein